MAAVAFAYAGSLQIQWQIIIVLIFLFFGTLAFFVVLYDQNDSEARQPLIASTSVQEEAVDENVGYQTHPSSIA